MNDTPQDVEKELAYAVKDNIQGRFNEKMQEMMAGLTRAAEQSIADHSREASARQEQIIKTLLLNSLDTPSETEELLIELGNVKKELETAHIEKAAAEEELQRIPASTDKQWGASIETGSGGTTTLQEQQEKVDTMQKMLTESVEILEDLSKDKLEAEEKLIECDQHNLSLEAIISRLSGDLDDSITIAEDFLAERTRLEEELSQLKKHV
jgi:hypothetical protein